MPVDVRAKVESIKSAKKAQKSRGSAGNYWMASCVRDLHMVDGKDGRAGIFFAGTEDAGEVPDVRHIFSGESSGAPPVEVSSGAAAGAKSSGGSKKKKPKAPKIRKAIKGMFRKDVGVPDHNAEGFATMNVSAHSGASGTASSMAAGTLNRNDIPQHSHQSQLSQPGSLRRNSTGGSNVPIPQMPQQVHAAAAMQMYSPNWELINNHNCESALTPPPSSTAVPTNLPNPAVMTGVDPTGGFQVGTTGRYGEQGGRRASFPAGGSEFPIEMFEPRPLREDRKGFVDESANDPAASAYFAASSQNPVQAQSDATSMAVGGGNAGGDALTNAHFQTEYSFMGINDVVKGHEEAEKRKGSYRDRLDRRSSWTSRDSHGSSTFLSSGSKRGLSDGDGDSVGTNEYEPPRRRPSIQSSLGGDLDDFRALDLDNDADFNDDFGISDGAPRNNAAFSDMATPVTAAASLPLDQQHQFSSGGVGGTGHMPGTMGRPATNSSTGRSDSNLSDGSFSKALQVLDEVITIDPPSTGTATVAAGEAAGAPSSLLAPTANPHAQQPPP